MEYQIISFGNGDILKAVFDAIAMCLNSQSDSLYIPLIRVSMIVGALWAALYAIYADYVKAITHWIIPMTAIMQLLFVPQVTLWIKDPIHDIPRKVDHVPYGLAMIASRISQIGAGITEQVEKNFKLPDDLKYQKTGALFASQLLQQAKSFRITNEDLAENMRQFVGQCVTYDALLGRKYTIEDLRHTDNIWALVSSRASKIRSFVWRDLRTSTEPRARPQIITCAEGVVAFNRQWEGELDKAAGLFGKKIFDHTAYLNPGRELLKYLPIAYTALGNMSKNANEILQQNMMIYAIVDGVEQKSTSLGNAPNFALRRAYLQQRSTYETLGAMAAETLPIMKAVLEAITYSAFLFVVPLALLPFGWNFLKHWIQTLLWLQMWPPLYAVLNYMMTLAARSKSISALSLSNEAGVTIASSVGLVNANADIAAMSGYLAMSIPFLCIAFARGVGSFVQAAGHLSQVTQGSASQAASEASTGNYSFGNVTQGVHQFSNISMLNHSHGASYRSGSFHQADGRSDLITTADGQQILNISSSNLPISLNVAETQSSQLSKQANQSYQKAVQKSESYANSMADTLRQSVELSEHVSKSQQFSDQFHQGKSIEQTEAINKSVQMIRDFAVSNSISDIQSAELLASASVGGDIGFASASLRGSLSTVKNLQDIYNKAEKVAQSEEFQSALREIKQIGNTQSFASHDDDGKKLVENIARSWDESDSFRKEASKSFKQAEEYQKQSVHTKNNAAVINTKYDQEFVDWLATQKTDNANGHWGIQHAQYIITKEPELTAIYAEKFLKERNLLPSEPIDIKNFSAENLKSSYGKEEDHIFIRVDKGVSESGMSELKTRAQQGGLKGAEDHGLKSNFLEKETTTEKTLASGQKQMEQTMIARSKEHEEKEKRAAQLHGKLGGSGSDWGTVIKTLSNLESKSKEEEIK